MKKILTFVAVALLSMNAMAADIFNALADASKSENTYTWTFTTPVVARNNNVFVELPYEANEGTISFTCKDAKADRFLYLVVNSVKDETRPIVMAKTAQSINFTENDQVKQDGKNYLLFQTSHDFKYITIELTANEVVKNSPIIKNFVIAGVEATINQEAKTITAALPYGTDKEAALVAATVELGGTATKWEYNGDKSQIIVSDGTNSVSYVLNISIKEASAENTITNVWLSNGMRAFIQDTKKEEVEIHEIRGCYMAGTEVPAVANFEKPETAESAVISEDKKSLTVKAENGDVRTYSIILTEVTPLAVDNLDKEITFDTTAVEAGSYIYTVYGWDASKGVKWAKPVDEATNLRVQAGKNRVYFFLPAAESVTFTGGSAGARDCEIRVNGEVYSNVTKTPAKDETITINLDETKPNMVSFEANGSANGDSGLIKMFVKSGTVTAISNAAAELKAVKTIENGQLVIIKNGIRYNAAGAKL